MSDLGNELEDLLGIQGIAATSRRLGGGQHGIHQRSKLLGTTSAVLSQNARISEFLDRRQAKESGAKAIEALGNLDPRHPDYLIARADVMKDLPEASADPTFTAFLGAHEQIFRQAEIERRDARQYLLNTALLQEKGMQDAAEDQRRSEEARAKEQREQVQEIERTVQDMPAAVQLIFRSEVAQGIPPQDAFKKATIFQDGLRLEAGLLETGIAPEELEAIRDPESQLIDPRKAARLVGVRENEQEEAANLEDELREMEAIYADGTFEVPGMTPEEVDEAEEKLATKIKRARKRLTDLRGLTRLLNEEEEYSPFK